MIRLCAMLVTLAASAARAQPATDPAAPPPSPPPPAPERRFAPDDELVIGSIGLYWENDGAYTRPNRETDKHYTNGLKVDFAFEGELADRWARAIPSLPGAPDPEDDMRAAFGIGLSQLMFTPADLSRDDLILDDRPYAGYLGFNIFLQRADKRTFEHFELDLGMIGPAAFAEEAQKQVHATFPNQIAPGGWRHQLHNEPVINLNYRRRLRFDLLDPELPMGAQIIPGAGVEVGTIRIAATADLLGRVGWNLPDDFGPPRILDLRDATGRHADGWSVYVYGRAGLRGVARDILLDGNTWVDSHSVRKELLVGEIQLGVLAHWRGLEVGYAQTWVSEEFQQQDKPSAYGAWTIGVRFEY